MQCPPQRGYRFSWPAISLSGLCARARGRPLGCQPRTPGVRRGILKTGCYHIVVALQQTFSENFSAEFLYCKKLLQISDRGQI